MAVLLQVGAIQIPQPVGVVNDFAHVIPADRAALIEQIANDVRVKSRGEIAVVTLADLGGRAPSDVALQIGRQWKVGKIGNPGDPTRNAGAVILIVPKETSSDGGHCFVATGSGAEGFITDAMAGAICRAAVPAFRERDYGAGVTLVTYQVAQKFAREFGFALDSTLRAPEAYAEPGVAQDGRGGGFPPQLLFLAFVFLVMLLSSRRRGRGCGCLPIFFPFPVGGGGGWRGGGGFGGGGGGGFGGFGGGGGFSGGGGGSNW